MRTSGPKARETDPSRVELWSCWRARARTPVSKRILTHVHETRGPRCGWPSHLNHHRQLKTRDDLLRASLKPHSPFPRITPANVTVCQAEFRLGKQPALVSTTQAPLIPPLKRENPLDFEDPFHEDRTVMITGIRRGSRAQEATRRLFEAILMGDLQPGERIDEARTAKQLHVGRGTLREALQALEDRGLVTRKRHTVVTKQTVEDAQILSVVRDRLEPLAAAIACERLTPTHTRNLEGLLGKMRQAIPRRDSATFLRYELAFHEYIWRMPRIRALDRVFGLVVPALFEFFAVRGSQKVSRNPSQAEKALRGLHEVNCKLLEVLKAGNPRVAGTAFLRVLRRNWQTISDLRKNPDQTKTSQRLAESDASDPEKGL